jgi:hypothetical protein
MSFPYKNPISSAQLSGPQSVLRTSTFGTNFSVLSTGGYMEVYELKDLQLILTADTYPSTIQLSANTIPINFFRGTGSAFSPNIINLNSDGISSGRRRLGMQVFVQETDTVYQYSIPNYETLWNNLSGLTGNSAVTTTDYATTINGRSQYGRDFISAWTGSTIEGVNGVTRENARWKIFWGSDIQITGGTYYSAITTLDLYNNTGGTVTITGFTGTVTGGTYNDITETLTLNNSDSSSFDVTGFTGGSISVAPNTGLGISEGTILSTTYNTLLDPTLSMPTAVGGIAQGTTVSDLSGDTFVSLFNDLLFPTQNPTYAIPTISMGGVVSSTAEVGRTISLSLTATGIKNDAGQYTQLRLLRDATVLFTDTTLTTGSTTNVPSQFGYADPNNPNISFTISPTPYSEVYTLPAPAGANTSTSTVYKSDGNYNAGLAKQNNKGSFDVRPSLVRSGSAPQSASNNYPSATYTYTNIYPYFWGVSSSQPTTSEIASLISGNTAINKVLSSAAGTIDISFNSSSQYLWFATFANYTNKTKWYVDAQNNGSIGGPTNLFQSPIIQSVSSPDGFWSGIDFDIYISNYQTTNTSMQLSNS